MSDPVITSVTPASGPTTGGSAVTLSGVDFQAGATVLFGGAAGAVTSVTSTSIKVTNPAGTAGPVTITVANPDGGSVTMAAAFTYVPASGHAADDLDHLAWPAARRLAARS